MGRKLSRNVWKTRSSNRQKRSEPAALRGQGGNEHGGSPWFQGEVEPGRAPAGEGRELLTPWVDERVRSLSHRGAVSLQVEIDRFSRHDACGRRGRAGQETNARTSLCKTHFSPILDGRAVEKSRENRSSGSHQRSPWLPTRFWPALQASRPATCWISSKLPAEIVR
jgi:hypothetical protein